jgi:hypothetical protein
MILRGRPAVRHPVVVREEAPRTPGAGLPGAGPVPGPTEQGGAMRVAVGDVKLELDATELSVGNLDSALDLLGQDGWLVVRTEGVGALATPSAALRMAREEVQTPNDRVMLSPVARFTGGDPVVADGATTEELAVALQRLTGGRKRLVLDGLAGTRVAFEVATATSLVDIVILHAYGEGVAGHWECPAILKGTRPRQPHLDRLHSFRHELGPGPSVCTECGFSCSHPDDRRRQDAGKTNCGCCGKEL